MLTLPAQYTKKVVNINQLNLTIFLKVIHASIESEDGNPVQSNPASRTAG